MRQGLVGLCLVTLAGTAGCGRDDERRGHETPEPSPSPSAGLAENGPPAIVCAGPSVDGGTQYEVTAYKDANGQYVHVVATAAAPDAGAPMIFADYTYFADRTPPPPTDIRVRYIFSASPPDASSHAIMVTEGGFTQEATVEVNAGGTVAAWLTCVRQTAGD